MEWRSVWAGQGTTSVRCPLEPQDSRKRQKKGKVTEERGNRGGEWEHGKRQGKGERD